MKAAAYTRYGPPDVVQIMDVEKPVPKDNEVLIKVRAASVNPADWRLMGGAPHVFRVLFRLRKPTPAEPGRLGHDVAGQVEVVGGNVTRFKPGDPVFGTCRGALAEYACVSESALIGEIDLREMNRRNVTLCRQTQDFLQIRHGFFFLARQTLKSSLKATHPHITSGQVETLLYLGDSFLTIPGVKKRDCKPSMGLGEIRFHFQCFP